MLGKASCPGGSSQQMSSAQTIKKEKAAGQRALKMTLETVPLSVFFATDWTPDTG